ncbi:unnamed protein product [marine sediment metagenome]|uniref:Uncharacterized protein n=1 Tax=marine sediment metagenome TaxID=412755 RepID=X1MV12_9ZZZZ
MDSYQLDIIIGPADTEEFINEYFKNWEGFVNTEEYAKAKSTSLQNISSFSSEWK